MEKVMCELLAVNCHQDSRIILPERFEPEARKEFRPAPGMRNLAGALPQQMVAKPPSHCTTADLFGTVGIDDRRRHITFTSRVSRPGEFRPSLSQNRT